MSAVSASWPRTRGAESGDKAHTILASGTVMIGFTLVMHHSVVHSQNADIFNLPKFVF